MLRNLNRSYARGRICGTPHEGVLGSLIPSTGNDGAGYAYNDLSLPADANKEIRGKLTAWPSAGTLFAYEDTSFTFTGAPDGIYTFQYQLYVDGVATGSPTTATLTVGNPGVTGTVAWTESDDTASASGNLTVTGAIGATEEGDTVSASGSIPLAARYARPMSDLSAGPWTPSTGTSLAAMLDESSADDSDYITASEAGTCEININPVTDPGTSSGQVVRYRCWSDSGSGLTVRLKQRSTLIAEWTHASLPTAPTTYTQALTALQADAITDYAALSFEFVALE